MTLILKKTSHKTGSVVVWVAVAVERDVVALTPDKLGEHKIEILTVFKLVYQFPGGLIVDGYGSINFRDKKIKNPSSDIEITNLSHGPPTCDAFDQRAQHVSFRQGF